MPHDQPILEYQTRPRLPKRPWWRTLFIWEAICLCMWGLALVGPVLVTAGIASFLFPIDLRMNDRPVRTSFERVLWTSQSVVLAAGGAMFVVWHRRQMRREKWTAPLCPGCRDYVTPIDGLCPKCGERLTAAVELTEQEKRDGRRGIVIFLVVVAVAALISLIPPLVERMRPGYGQTFATDVTVVDVEDGTVLPPVVRYQSIAGDRDYAWTSSFSSNLARVSWRYPGEPLTIGVTSEGYEVVHLELTPDSPAAMTVPLKRRDRNAK